jgi:hypothetical protein
MTRNVNSSVKTAASTNSAFRNCVNLSTEQAELLSAPLSAVITMDKALSCRYDNLARVATRLGSISANDALVLLKASFSIPNLMHSTRASPGSGQPALESFDGLLRKYFGSITNTDPSDIQRIQASLPVRSGGLGVRRVSSRRRLHLQPSWPQLRAHVTSRKLICIGVTPRQTRPSITCCI